MEVLGCIHRSDTCILLCASYCIMSAREQTAVLLPVVTNFAHAIQSQFKRMYNGCKGQFRMYKARKRRCACSADLTTRKETRSQSQRARPRCVIHSMFVDGCCDILACRIAFCSWAERLQPAEHAVVLAETGPQESQGTSAPESKHSE